MVRRREANDLTWQLKLRVFTHQKRRQQRETIAEIKRIAHPGVLRSPYDMASGDDRVRMIGCAISAAGDRWARTHGRQLAWLASQGITPEQALERYRAWRAEVHADPFWRKESDGQVGDVQRRDQPRRHDSGSGGD